MAIGEKEHPIWTVRVWRMDAWAATSCCAMAAWWRARCGRWARSGPGSWAPTPGIMAWPTATRSRAPFVVQIPFTDEGIQATLAYAAEVICQDILVPLPA